MKLQFPKQMGLVTSLLVLVVLLASPARAERGELAVGLQGSLMVAGFGQGSGAAVTMATWSVGAAAEYGLLDDLYLTAAFHFTTFDASAAGFKTAKDGLDYQGTLWFNSQLYFVELGARYKVISGYNLAPYVEARVGWARSSYGNAKLVNAAGLDYGLGLADWGENALTVTAGVSLDYRLANMVFIGLSASYTYVLGGGLLRQFISVPLQVSYYW